jgi:hypothetical protein
MRLKKTDRQKLGVIREYATDLQLDEERRLRNALTALALADVGWLAWLERETPPRLPANRDKFISLTRLVEARARVVVLTRYRAIIRIPLSRVIERDWAFDDNGCLTPG